MILFACVIQLIAVIAAHSSVHTVMPKIRTTRTKKPPEGYEEIEAVCENYIFLCVTQKVRRFSMTTQRKCGTLKTKPMKANGEPNHYGLSCVSRILVLDTSTNSITNEKLSPRNSMIGYSRRATLTQSELMYSLPFKHSFMPRGPVSLPSGRKLATKSYVVSGASRRG